MSCLVVVPRSQVVCCSVRCSSEQRYRVFRPEVLGPHHRCQIIGPRERERHRVGRHATPAHVYPQRVARYGCGEEHGAPSIGTLGYCARKPLVADGSQPIESIDSTAMELLSMAIMAVGRAMNALAFRSAANLGAAPAAPAGAAGGALATPNIPPMRPAMTHVDALSTHVMHLRLPRLSQNGYGYIYIYMYIIYIYIYVYYIYVYSK